jgi:hypothetical protein
MATGADRPEKAGSSPISGTRAEPTVRLVEPDVAELGDVVVDNADELVTGGSTTRIAGEGIVNDAGVTVPRAADESVALVAGPLAAAAGCAVDGATFGAEAAAVADQPDGEAGCAKVGCPAGACATVGLPTGPMRCGKPFPPGGP